MVVIIYIYIQTYDVYTLYLLMLLQDPCNYTIFVGTLDFCYANFSAKLWKIRGILARMFELRVGTLILILKHLNT